ncbi:hypothetical protein CF149_12913 [Pseudomonas psychrophila]|nr:hypothetical protein CF149_12913 [Pseudomonas psychrophila]
MFEFLPVAECEAFHGWQAPVGVGMLGAIAQP